MLFIAPAIAGLLLFRVFPIFDAAANSFYAVNYAEGAKRVFVGLENYWDVFHDHIFWESLWVTIKLNLIINPLQVVAAFLLALLVRRNTKANRAFRTIFLLPLGVSVAVASSVWGILLDTNSGLVNSFLKFLSLKAQDFLLSPGQALWCIVLIASWCGVSYWMTFFLAGLQEIPETLYESADIDGAGTVRKLIRITVPLMRRTFLFVIVADTSANFLLFVPMFTLTKGGPMRSTNVLMHEIYTSAFVYSDVHRALTLSTLLLIVLFVVIAAQFRIMGVRND